MRSLKRIAVLGGKGMLGTDLADCLSRVGYDPVIFDLPQFDITRQDQLKEAVTGVDYIVNCAAYTNVDGAETHQVLAHRINAEAVEQIGRIAKVHQVPVLHISTDFVFDGRKDTPYVETDHPHPISVYGASKLAGERLLAESGCDYCIVRLQWTYGRAGTNFIKKLLVRAQTLTDLKVVDDQVGSPTATTEVAITLCQCIKKQARGLYHYASAGYVSRYEMAQFIVEHLGLAVRVQPCRTSEFNSPAARPLNSRFDCSKIEALLDQPIRTWQASLQQYLETL